MKRWETSKLHHLAYLFQGTLITPAHLSFTSLVNVGLILYTNYYDISCIQHQSRWLTMFDDDMPNASANS